MNATAVESMNEHSPWRRRGDFTGHQFAKTNFTCGAPKVTVTTEEGGQYKMSKEFVL